MSTNARRRRWWGARPDLSAIAARSAKCRGCWAVDAAVRWRWRPKGGAFPKRSWQARSSAVGKSPLPSDAPRRNRIFPAMNFLFRLSPPLRCCCRWVLRRNRITSQDQLPRHSYSAGREGDRGADQRCGLREAGGGGARRSRKLLTDYAIEDRPVADPRHPARARCARGEIRPQRIATIRRLDENRRPSSPAASCQASSSPGRAASLPTRAFRAAFRIYAQKLAALPGRWSAMSSSRPRATPRFSRRRSWSKLSSQFQPGWTRPTVSGEVARCCWPSARTLRSTLLAERSRVVGLRGREPEDEVRYLGGAGGVERAGEAAPVIVGARDSGVDMPRFRRNSGPTRPATQWQGRRWQRVRRRRARIAFDPTSRPVVELLLPLTDGSARTIRHAHHEGPARRR